jgi:hypothetical protein
MAKFTLLPFEKDLISKYTTQVSGSANLTANELYISFEVTGDLSWIDFGNYTPEKYRRLNLFEKTCFEFFLKIPNGQYLEFNFSPNFSWNIFSFYQLRGPLLELPMEKDIDLDILNSSDKFFLVAKISKDILPMEYLNNLKLAQFGITMVIKSRLGTISYWAIDHKDSRPNFHHYDSFIGKF